MPLFSSLQFKFHFPGLKALKKAMENEEDDLPFVANPSQVSKNFPLRGMESVIATVSGYHGLEKFKLIKLITQAGATYIGTMTKLTTHLVCWDFEGRKYSLAKGFGTKIVSHRWFEDCMKEGKRLLEDPYLMESGKQVGTLSWKVPAIADASSKKGHLLISKEKKVLKDQSNMINDAKVHKIDSRNLDIGCSSWVGSHLQRKPEDASSYYSLLSARNKSNAHVAIGKITSTEAVSKGRRLVKKSAQNELMNFTVLNCKQEPSQSDISKQLNSSIAVSNDLDIMKNGSANGSCNEENRSMGLEEVEDVGEPATDFHSILGNSNNNTSPHEMGSQNGLCDFEKKRVGKVEEDDDLVEQVGVPTAIEVSCVICWTDFSSTRGVLQCGHRFCYSCIENWADQMVSKGKVSTCPLCKIPFTIITRVEGAAFSDQKIYSQTLPCTSSRTDVLMLADREHYYSETAQPPLVCYECRNREPVDLLLSCHICRNQWVHSYCLDPPLVPWTCICCRDHRMLYQRYR